MPLVCHRVYTSSLLQVSVLALVSMFAATSCSASEDHCTSCLTYDQCIAGGCAISVPRGASYDQAFCSTPSRRLIGEDSMSEKCSKFYGLAGAILMGMLTSFPLAMVFYKFTKELAAKRYARSFLSRPSSEVARVQATITNKEIICEDWVGTQGKQSPTASVRGIKFFYNYFDVDFYTSDQHIVARAACRSPIAYEKFQPTDKIEVAYALGNPRELLLVDDARLVEEDPPTKAIHYIGFLALALPFAVGGFLGILKWLCWCGYIVLGVVPMVGFISGYFIYGFVTRPREMSSRMVTVSPFADAAATIGKSEPPPPEVSATSQINLEVQDAKQSALAHGEVNV